MGRQEPRQGGGGGGGWGWGVGVGVGSDAIDNPCDVTVDVVLAETCLCQSRSRSLHPMPS
jgi:hypothetical protein